MMDRRHDDRLSERIERVAWLGISEIKKWELNAWYAKDRIGRTVWRDLKARFEEAADPGSELYIYDSIESFTLIHSDNLKNIDEKIGEAE